MFVKIKNHDVLKVENIERMVKNEETEYEITEEYREYINTNKNVFSFFTGQKHTDVIIAVTYLIEITTVDDDITYSFETEEDRNETFNAIWDVLEKAGVSNEINN